MLCINVVVVSWHCKSPLCRLHPTVDPSNIGEERGREEREGEGAPKGPELENCSVTAKSQGDQGMHASSQFATRSIHHLQFFQFIVVSIVVQFSSMP